MPLFRCSFTLLMLIATTNVTASAAAQLEVSSGAFRYLTSTYYFDNAISGSGPVLSAQLSGLTNYTDPTLPGSYLTGTYGGTATASYGVLRATNFSTENGGITYPAMAFYTQAGFTETFSFNTSSSGGTGYLVFTIHGSGTSTYSQTYEGVHAETWGGFASSPEGTDGTPHYITTTNTSVTQVL